jgi:DNA polymerase III epsilon subunit-like protein
LRDPGALELGRLRRGLAVLGACMALIALDLETGGLDPTTDRILEIAAARLGPDLAPVDGYATAILPNPGIVPCAPRGGA